MISLNAYIRNSPDLSDKVFLITGASSGLGYALSEVLLQKNATIIWANRSQKNTDKALKRITKKYPHASIRIFYFDQASKESIHSLVSQIVNDGVKIDGYVFNAGVFHPQKGTKTAENIDLTFGVNYYGNYLLTKALCENRLITKTTRLVYTSSLAARRRLSTMAFYQAINGEGLTRHQAYQVSKTAINIFALGIMNRSPLIPFTCPGQAYLYHPGITNTNIARFKSKLLMGLAHFVMKIVFHHPRKGALGALMALSSDQDLNNKMIFPRGFKEIGGFPKSKKIDEGISIHLPTLITISENI